MSSRCDHAELHAADHAQRRLVVADPDRSHHSELVARILYNTPAAELQQVLRHQGPQLVVPGGHQEKTADSIASRGIAKGIDRGFVTSAKKFTNFNEFSEIKKNS